MSSIQGRSNNRLPGEPDEFLDLLEPAHKQTLLVLARRDDTPAIDSRFAQRLQDDLLLLLATTNLVAIDPSIGVDETPGTDQANPHAQSRKIIRIWPILEIAAAALLIFAFAGIYFGSDQMLSWLPWRQEKSIPELENVNVPMFRGNLARTGEMPGPAPSKQPSLLWNYQSPDSLMVSAPVVVDGVVYASDGSATKVGVDALNEPWEPGIGPHQTFAIDANTGSRLWEVPFGNGFPSVPAVAGGLVYVNNGDGNLYAFDAASGAERWRFPTGFHWVSTPAIDDGVIYVAGGYGGNGGSTEATLYAVDAETGTKRWEYTFEGSVGSSPAIENGVIYVGSAAGDLGDVMAGEQTTGGVHAVDAKSGQRQWFVATSSGIAATPAIADGLVVVGDLADNLYVLDVASGEVRWNKQLDDTPVSAPGGERAMLSASAAISNGRVYVGTFDGIIHAYDVANGTEVWTAETSYGLSSPVTVVGNSVFVGTTDGNIVALDSGTGAVRWNAAAPPAISSHLSSPTVASGVVYVGGANAVFALGELPTDEPSSESPSAHMFRGNLARTGEMPGPAPSKQPSLLWSYQNTEPLFVTAPVVVDGVVYASDDSPDVVGINSTTTASDEVTYRTYAVDATSGSMIWEHEFDVGGRPSVPAVADDLVFINCTESNLYAIDAVSGIERWRFLTGFAWASTPAVDNGVVYVAGGNNQVTQATLFAIDATTGEKRWEYTFEGYGGSSPAISDGTIYVGSLTGDVWSIGGTERTSGGVHAVDAITGERQWFVPASKGVAATPAVAGGVVYVGDLGDILYALDGGTGEILWREELDPDNAMPTKPAGEHPMISASAAVANGFVYLGTFDGVIHAFDVSTGDERWTATTSFGLVRPVTVAGDTLLVGTTDGNVLALDVANGATRWQAETPSSGSSPISSPTIVNGVVYIGATNAIYALGDAETPATATTIEA